MKKKKSDEKVCRKEGRQQVKKQFFFGTSWYSWWVNLSSPFPSFLPITIWRGVGVCSSGLHISTLFLSLHTSLMMPLSHRHRNGLENPSDCSNGYEIGGKSINYPHLKISSITFRCGVKQKQNKTNKQKKTLIPNFCFYKVDTLVMMQASSNGGACGTPEPH